jgi:hypothetical protein
VYSLRRPLRAALLGACASALHCSYQPPFRPAVGKARNVSLRFEGSCAHLACCSTYAVSAPTGSAGAFQCDDPTLRTCRRAGWFAPGFTCDPGAKGRYRQPGDPPYLACNDNERWLALPDLGHAQCGETYLVCREGVRVTAVARDRSASNASGRFHYEGSLGLWNAIGADLTQRETFVSVYPLHERDLIASDPHCVGR